MSNKLSMHVSKDKIKWIIVLVVGLCLVAAIIGLFVKLDRRTTDERLGMEAYSIGGIKETGEVDKTIKTSIYSRNTYSVDDMSVELVGGADVKYSLYFYGAKGVFIEKKDYTSDYDVSTKPEEAETFRIVITPIAGGEVLLTDISGLIKQVTVRVKK